MSEGDDAAPTLVFPRPRGAARIFSVRGVPVYFHWTFPLGGLVISAIVGFEIEQTVWFCLAFILLVAVHELGHALAAVALRLEVFTVEISGVGGLCRIRSPHRPRDIFIFYAGGLGAQAALLVLTIAYVQLLGAPDSLAGHCLVLTFTVVNVALFIVCLWPYVTPDGLSSDGRMLWKTYMHVNQGHPHPLDPMLETRLFDPSTSLLDIDELVPDGFSVGVEILNDETTPMELVVAVLEDHLALPRDEAVERMLEIHRKGGVLIPFATYEEATAVADAIAAATREQGHALVCRAVDAAARRPRDGVGQP